MDATGEQVREGSTVVFLGPTLSVQEAQQVLPNAHYCRPAQCGDIVSLFRLPTAPARIALIDGVFEVTASVWHKEILYAMQQGAAVYGASSMGALRAAEMAVLGMIGVGAVFQDYLHGRLIDDDEVAVLHATREGDYRVMTDAMVNIRATVATAQDAGVLDEALAAVLIARAKESFYQERVLRLIAMAVRREENAVALDRFLEWLDAGGVVDAKKADALALLNALATNAPVGGANRSPVSSASPHTVYFRNLLHDSITRPIGFSAEWLPRSEKLVRWSRALGHRYPLVRQTAVALSLLDACARAREEQNGQRQLLPVPIGVVPGLRWAEWCERNGVAAKEEVTCRRVHRVLGSIMAGGSGEGQGDPYLEGCLRHFQLYALSRGLASQGIDPLTHEVDPGDPLYEALSALRIVHLLSRLWRVLDSVLIDRAVGLSPEPKELLRYASELRASLGVVSAEGHQEWLQQNHLTNGQAYLSFVVFSMRLNQCLSFQSSSYYGDIVLDERRSWLLSALRCTDVYHELAERLADTVRFRADVSTYWGRAAPQAREALALDCDLEGFAELEGMLADL